MNAVCTVCEGAYFNSTPNNQVKISKEALICTMRYFNGALSITPTQQQGLIKKGAPP
jgi:hypothetical protein